MKRRFVAALPVAFAIACVVGSAVYAQEGPATVTGEWGLTEVTKETQSTAADGVFEWRGQVFDLTLDADDPRLSGSGTLRRADDDHSGGVTSDGSLFNVRADRWRIENEGGSWDGTTHSLWFFDEEAMPEIHNGDIVLVGGGGYEGLFALLDLDESHADNPGDLDRSFKGVIIHRSPPQVPEAE